MTFGVKVSQLQQMSNYCQSIKICFIMRLEKVSNEKNHTIYVYLSIDQEHHAAEGLLYIYISRIFYIVYDASIDFMAKLLLTSHFRKSTLIRLQTLPCFSMQLFIANRHFNCFYLKLVRVLRKCSRPMTGRPCLAYFVPSN
jgi:hypothetical protein